MCQLLAHHPYIFSSGYSSPLLNGLQRIRNGFSNDDFLLSQLDSHFDISYNRMKNAYRGFFNGWFAETDRPYVVDKNRGWLGLVDFAREIAPDCYFIVNIRELVQLYGSIESQHQKTVLLNSADGAGDKTPQARAAHYFNGDGLVNICIGNVKSALTELPLDIKERVKVVQYERLATNTTAIMNELFVWMGLPSCDLDPNALDVMPKDADSFYRYKYPHNTYSEIRPVNNHWVSDEIKQAIVSQFPWYYETFYPEVLNK